MGMKKNNREYMLIQSQKVPSNDEWWYIPFHSLPLHKQNLFDQDEIYYVSVNHSG